MNFYDQLLVFGPGILVETKCQKNKTRDAKLSENSTPDEHDGRQTKTNRY